MAMKNEVNVPLIVVIGVVSAFVLAACIISLQAWYVSMERQQVAQYDDAVFPSLATLRADQQAHLNGYRWINRDQQLVSLPIEEAMKIVAQNQGRLPATRPGGGS